MTDIIKSDSPVDIQSEWYVHFLDECRTHVHVTRNIWRWEIIKARHGLGQLIVEAATEHGLSVNNLINQLSVDMDYAPRTLYYCTEFYTAFPKLEDCPIGESAVWQNVIDLLPHKELPEKTGKKEAVIKAVTTSKPSKDVLKKYYEYIKRHGCVLCDPPNKDDVVDPHHWPTTKARGGKDWQVVPLCRRHHTEVQENPFDMVWVVEFSEYLHDTIFVLFSEILKSNDNKR